MTDSYSKGHGFQLDCGTVIIKCYNWWFLLFICIYSDILSTYVRIVGVMVSGSANGQ